MTENLIKKIKELKENGTCPIKDPKFYEVWEWETIEPIYKKGKVVKTV